ncbi:bifunctional oligoribonuclease/PAP phosphatase NrnA [Intestinibacillus massiliensis]|nr:bifunctional oligoribonuclease/PAP phosphatase NrnA [Intestinibacillus massiliensis]
MGVPVTVPEAARALLDADDILILTHRRPDGDTAGCAGALCRGLRALGKRAFILPNPEITKRYAPLITPCYPEDGFNPQFVVTTDIADYGLFTDNAKCYEGRIGLAIDHHRSNPLFGGKNLVAPEAGACAEVIYDVLMAMGVPLTLEIAESLYVGVSTDTGCFRYSNTTPHTHAVAAACLTTGLDGGEWNRVLFETKSRPRFEMERIIFDTMEFFEDGNIALATLYRADIDRTAATPDDLDSIAALPRQIEGVEIGLTLTENRDGTCKASVRTTREVDASALCQQCGGGGHLRAAGASFASLAEARERLLSLSRAVYHG